MDIVKIYKAYVEATMANFIISDTKAAEEAWEARKEAWETFKKAKKTAEGTPEFKAWKKKEKAVEEAEEYKDYKEAYEACEKAKVAYWKTSEFKTLDEAYSAYLKARKKSEDEIAKVIKAMPTKFMGKELTDYVSDYVREYWGIE